MEGGAGGQAEDGCGLCRSEDGLRPAERGRKRGADEAKTSGRQGTARLDEASGSRQGRARAAAGETDLDLPVFVPLCDCTRPAFRPVPPVPMRVAIADKIRCGRICMHQKHQKLEEMRMAEDTKQTTRLADAFREDALRQNAFKTAMLRAKAAERRQQQLMMEREHREDREVEHAVREKRDSFSQKKYASISQLKSLEHALLRSNPELEVLRPRHGDRDLSDSTEGDARGQNLVGDLNRDDDRDFAGRRHTRYADHARWQQLAQVGRNVGMHWGSPDEVDDFTVPASNTPRV